MSDSKKYILGLLGISGLLIFVFVQTRLSIDFDPLQSSLPKRAFTLSQSWKLEIANTDALRTLGLGERDVLPIGTGMLFLFETPKRRSFWMKGMRFPLDIVFLYRGKIVFIERGIQPDDPKIVTPSASIDQVLELNAGEAEHLSIGGRIWYWRSS
jgi:uncharacterized membrane protein (UPF0127 family)